ncbi:MAG: hydroxymethylglutaryl-CoA lyase [Bacteroidota bacterium]|nr:hydroxymethylglutaryl-CoA lyase [Bacteroidota bacterium]MDP4214748.1 hydroxymethylglutaryl-CoA lyase [Bacteroidota bacterium]MDP4257663.1 hydroxymethylglutaryl-CoA lyase [Bacteroidota bacterium]
MSPFHTPRIPQTRVDKGRDLPFSAGLPVSLVECPRDAMQGWPHIIPTEKKIDYLNALLQVGFDTLDFGSFVSARAIPQMADTAEVIRHLDKGRSRDRDASRSRVSTRLLAIVANFRGAEEAAGYDLIDCLGFPFSVSETFQLRNANKTIDGSLATVEEMLAICAAKEKELIVYLSMAFGNPYGDPWSEELVYEWAESLSRLGVKTLSVADTVGLATPDQVFSVTDYLIRQLPGCTIGVHLHSTHRNWKAKIDAALQAGCRRFDGALKGIGGCPMAGDELVGNMDSALMIPYFQDAGLLTGLDQAALQESLRIAGEIFTKE